MGACCCPLGVGRRASAAASKETPSEGAPCARGPKQQRCGVQGAKLAPAQRRSRGIVGVGHQTLARAQHANTPIIRRRGAAGVSLTARRRQPLTAGSYRVCRCRHLCDYGTSGASELTSRLPGAVHNMLDQRVKAGLLRCCSNRGFEVSYFAGYRHLVTTTPTRAFIKSSPIY